MLANVLPPVAVALTILASPLCPIRAAWADARPCHTSGSCLSLGGNRDAQRKGERHGSHFVLDDEEAIGRSGTRYTKSPLRRDGRADLGRCTRCRVPRRHRQPRDVRTRKLEEMIDAALAREEAIRMQIGCSWGVDFSDYGGMHTGAPGEGAAVGSLAHEPTSWTRASGRPSGRRGRDSFTG